MVRVRFAPSPTGPLHIGGVRTALYNYLFSRKNGGVFILRIEDTDQARYVEGAEEYIMDALKWCGIEVDEGINEGGASGPYRQSDRKDIYREYAERLVNTGHAYYAFDTPEDLESLRKELENNGNAFIYNASVRDQLNNSLAKPEADWRKLIAEGVPYVIRYKMPGNTQIEIDDIIRDHIVVDSSTLDDKVLFKSDGMPTYHLANIVDDHLMEITHVIRGEEWLPSLPLHFMIYRSFGWNPPLFAHLPLLLKPDGKGKLSKRDGDRLGFPVFPLFWPFGETARGYREDGYYPEAFVNMIALLGWNPGTEREIFSMEELIEEFSLERVQKSGARFDPDKARWFNHQYLQKMTDTQLAFEFREILRSKGFHYDINELEEVISLVKERISFISEIWDETDFFFKAPESYDQEVIRKKWNEDTPRILREIMTLIEDMEDYTSESTENEIKHWISDKGYNTGNVLNALRLVVVGAPRGPHLFDILNWIGKEETLKRIEKGVSVITK